MSHNLTACALSNVAATNYQHTLMYVEVSARQMGVVFVTQCKLPALSYGVGCVILRLAV